MLEYKDITMPEELYYYMRRFRYGFLTKKGIIINNNRFMFDELCYDNYVLQNTNDLNESKTGICFDLTEFARKWLVDHDYNVKTYYEFVDSNMHFSHSFVVYNESKFGTTWKWFETTWSRYDGIHIYNSLDELCQSIYKVYKNVLKRNTISSKDIKIVEFDTPKEHSTLDEYIKNVKRGKLLVLKK